MILITLPLVLLLCSAPTRVPESLNHDRNRAQPEGNLKLCQNATKAIISSSKQRITNKGLQTKSPQVPTPARLLARRLAPPQSWKEEQEGPAVTAGNCNVASNINSFIFHVYRELGSIEGEAAKVNGELAAPNGQPLQVGHLSRICISVVYLEKCKII